ncbi:Methylated-DNA--protein-cysteine methyltransferase [Candidatus Phaeomarinobacter ectocarpi]|uniref:Methylated-DNA--protein-cysteine methyltransferase n=2 Tax=Candidatus Phaeomarinibacter ectocarpi TaxID=1458461 RepID=X5MMW7_9HYPH|nr:Methylated-DNA--protein-cysteine methyltransferase [Candidatus Phaeomarinobacter ectocarpi]
MHLINHATISRMDRWMIMSDFGQRIAGLCASLGHRHQLPETPMHILKRELRYTYIPSPIGDLLVAGDADSLHLISFPTGSKTIRHAEHWQRDDDGFRDVAEQLAAYFAGDLTQFNLPLTLDGTDFQNEIWRNLATIPYGQTASYGEMAKKAGRPKASRAVGAANGANPLPIVLPCHRVIGSTGALTGFGGGMDAKKFLLSLEGALPAQGALL